MILPLLKKEFRLCLHPTTPLMLALSALILIPNYPYALAYFYISLGFFFICITGREQHDVSYTLSLPVAKGDVVTARQLFFVLLELLQLALAALLIPLHNRLLSAPNQAGMDANLSLLAEGFLFYALFHLLFFPSYYRDVNKVGVSFIKSTVGMSVLLLAEIVACYTVPLFRDVLDTPDPAHMGAKLLFLLVCVVIYVLCVLLSIRVCKARFLKQDIH